MTDTTTDTISMYRIDKQEIMKELDRHVCGQMNACSPEKQQRGCAYCADITDDVLETYFRLKTAEINRGTGH